MFPPLSERSSNDHDGAIRATDSDAAIARWSAVQKGYFSDPFIRHFVQRPHLQPARPPLINVGTYVRSESIDELVSGWLDLSQKEGTKCQIVSLGAGSDTRFWRLATGPQKHQLAAYVEVDFSENTTKKAMSIRKSKDLSTVLGAPEDVKLASGGTTLHSPVYHLLPADLRRPPSESLAPLFASSDFALSPSLPTLLLFECVLVYMSSDASSALIQYFVDHISAPLGSAVYEMFGLGDAFGKVMLNNLKSRNVDLPGVDAYPTLESLPGRFLRHGFTTAQALTLRDIRRVYINPAESERISELEMLDEIEELELVLEHYAVTWGVKLSAANSLQAAWTSWGLSKKMPVYLADD